MAQYKHDRFFKFYIQSLYKTKENPLQNVRVRNDKDLEIDLMFLMGIVVIDRLPDSAETLRLKTLGNQELARKAFGKIEQLSSERREKVDTIRTCVKYCVYLRDIPTDSLTAEERDFMKTMAEIDAWYETQISNAELKGEERQKQTGAKYAFGTDTHE
jgi:hypothetical protein